MKVPAVLAAFLLSLLSIPELKADARFEINGRMYLVRGKDIRYSRDANGRINRIWADGRTVYQAPTVNTRPVPTPIPRAIPVEPPVRRAVPVNPATQQPAPVTRIEPPGSPVAPAVIPKVVRPAPTPKPIAPTPPPAPPTPPPSPEELAKIAAQKALALEQEKQNMNFPVTAKALSALKAPVAPLTRTVHDHHRLSLAYAFAENIGILVHLTLKARKSPLMQTHLQEAAAYREVTFMLKEQIVFSLAASAETRPFLVVEGQKTKVWSQSTLLLLKDLARIARDRLQLRIEGRDPTAPTN